VATTLAYLRTVEGREIPVPGRWKIDPGHSTIQFIARHMMISKVRGQFREFSGTIEIADAPEKSRAEVTIQAASLDTGDENRDGHLKSADFLDVERFPQIRFRSTSVHVGDGDRWALTGDLTIRDVTKPVTLYVEFCGAAPDPWGNARAGFLAAGEINRDDFDVSWNQMLETGGFLVGKGVKIEIDAETVLQSEK